MNYNINLAEAIKTEEFKEYWATKAVVENWKISATKTKLVVWYDKSKNDKYAEFTIKTFEKDDLGVMVKCDDYEITPHLEMDSFNCTAIEIAKCCMYYFHSRF